MRSLLNLFISLVFLIWFIASIVSMIYVSRVSSLVWLIPVILGQFFMVFGILGAIAFGRSMGKGLWLDIFVILVGAAVLAFGLLRHYGDDDTRAFLSSHIPAFAGAGLFLAGIMGTLSEYISSKRSKLKYSYPIVGECVKLNTRVGSGGNVLKSPVYEICLDGQTIRLSMESYSNVGIPQIGEKRTLYIDKSDLDGYYEPIADKKCSLIVYFIFAPMALAGLVTAVISAFM